MNFGSVENIFDRSKIFSKDIVNINFFVIESTVYFMIIPRVNSCKMIVFHGVSKCVSEWLINFFATVRELYEHCMNTV